MCIICIDLGVEFLCDKVVCLTVVTSTFVLQEINSLVLAEKHDRLLEL